MIKTIKPQAVNNKVVNWMGAAMRPSFFLAFTILALSACSPPQAPTEKSTFEVQVESESTKSVKPQVAAGNISIYRDQYGTPHVVANNNFDVYFGFGYAVATDRLFQMEMLKRTVEGRVAEVLGSDYLDLDTHVRTTYDHRAVAAQLAKLDHGDREVLQAYADGFSQRIAEVLDNQTELLPKEFSDYDFQPEAWTAYDVAMIFVGSIIHRYSDFNSELDNLGLLNSLTEQHGAKTAAEIFDASKWLTDPGSPTTVPRNTSNASNAVETTSAVPQTLANLGTPVTNRVVLEQSGKFLGTITSANASNDDSEILHIARKQISEHGFSSPEYAAASNFWSINKKLSDADGVLVNGPQFGFGLPSYVYGIGLHGGDFNVVGNTLLGLPTLLFAHNDKVGWGSTAGMSDQVDVYREQLVAGKPDHYRHKDQDVAFESWQETIPVRGQASVTATARRSIHGMVVQTDAERNIAYTRARAWEGAEVATLMAWVNLAKDKTMDSVQTRLSKIAANINFYYMDVSGNIGYTHGGRYPLRAPGHDSRLTADGTGNYDWLGYRPYSENPTVRNPHQGFIVNWNNRPAAGWLASDLWPYTWSKADRSRHIMDVIENAKTLSIKSVWEIAEQVSYDDVSAAFLMPYLEQAMASGELDEMTQAAWDTVAKWDREWRLEENGRYGPAEMIIEAWTIQLFDLVIKDDVGEKMYAMYSATNNPNHPLGASMSSSVGAKVLLRNLDALAAGDSSSYDFFNGKDSSAVLKETFIAAVAALSQLQGEDISSWSLEAAPMQWKPFNFRGVPQASPESLVELPAYMNRGSENNLFVVEDGNFSGFDVIPPGQSGFVSQAGEPSKNAQDQLGLYASFEYKSIPFTIEQVRESAVSTEVIDSEQGRATAAIQNSLAKAQEHANLNAFIHLDKEGALATAKQADQDIADGKSLGPLHGVAIAVKDNIHVAGMPNTAGTKGLKDFYPAEHNPVIQRLVDAGAIILGKTNMHELAFGITSNNYAFGTVRNAHNPDRIAGGSSGGTAVAIAAGIVDYGLGSDTGGSTRIPPALNGVVGFRPTLGRYPLGAITPVASSRDTVGPITKTMLQMSVLDCVITACKESHEPAKLEGLRLGIPREYFYANLSAEVAENIQQSLSKLTAAGVELIEVEMSGLKEANDGISFPVALHEIMQELPVYLRENSIDLSVEQLVDLVQSPDVKATLQSQLGAEAMPKEAYQQALDVYIPRLKSIYRQTFEKYNIAALIMPTVPLTATPIATSNETVELNGAQVPTFPTFIQNTDPISNIGMPSLTLPSGRDSDNMPIGLMLDGLAGSDRQLISIGLAIEGILSYQ